MISLLAWVAGVEGMDLELILWLQPAQIYWSGNRGWSGGLDHLIFHNTITTLGVQSASWIFQGLWLLERIVVHLERLRKEAEQS